MLDTPPRHQQSLLMKWLAWLVITFFVGYSFCLNTAAAVFADSIRSSLHVNTLDVVYAVGTFTIAFAFMQIPAGYLLDRFNSKLIVSLSIFLLAIGNVLATLSHTLSFFVFSNLIQGIGAAFAFIASGVLISRWFAAKHFPIIFGLTQTLACFIAASTHLLFFKIVQSHSWHSVYQVLALFGFFLFVLSIIFIRSPLPSKKPVSLVYSLAAVIKSGQLWLCAVAAGTSFGVLLAYASFWYLPIQRFFSVPEMEAVIISGMIFFGIGIGIPLTGWFSNYIQSRKMVLHLTLTIGVMALILGIYLPHFNFSSLFIIKIVSFLIGFFISGSMLYYTVASELVNDEIRGVALSLINTLVALFNALMMFIPYFFITTISTQFYTYLWILPFSVLISILLTYFINDTCYK